LILAKAKDCHIAPPLKLAITCKKDSNKETTLSGQLADTGLVHTACTSSNMSSFTTASTGQVRLATYWCAVHTLHQRMYHAFAGDQSVLGSNAFKKRAA